MTTFDFNTMDGEIKNLFEKIGLEQAPEDFTLRVMNKIEHGFVKAPVKMSIWRSYRFLAGYIIAFIIIAPLTVPAVRYLSSLRVRPVNLDFSFIYEWFDTISEIIASGTLTLGIVIIAAILIMIFSLVFGLFVIHLSLPQGTHPMLKTGS
ncbi:MAG: hypothetical protein R6W78_11580 [Bacteroidales bacterium]